MMQMPGSVSLDLTLKDEISELMKPQLKTIPWTKWMILNEVYEEGFKVEDEIDYQNQEMFPIRT